MDINMEDLRSEFQDLSADQLHDLRDIVEEELECLEQYSDCWNEFNAKYNASLDSLEKLSKINANGNLMLFKLGNHVFMQGKLMKPKTVLVYLGDGYHAKMSLDDAKMFFKRKTESLLKDFKEYEEGNNNREYIYMLLQDILGNKVREKMDKLDEGENLILNSSNQNP